MDNLYFISIIIPVYNARKYLPDCLFSILKCQGFQDFEVILINDGSTDGSGEMCDEYAKKDKRIKVIHGENGGASKARNTGIRKAVGKYILFIDSDDFIADNSIEKIVATIADEGETDVVLLNATSIFPDGSRKPHVKFVKKHFYGQKQGNVLINISKKLPDCVWGKLIKRKIIVMNDIYFTEGIICEDVDFVMNLFMHAKTYNSTDFDFYYYRDGREGSVMNTRSNKLFTDVLFIISKWLKMAETIYKEHDLVIYNWTLLTYCWVLIPRYSILSWKDKKLYKRKVDELRWLLDYSVDKKVVIIRICYKLSWLGFVSGMMALYYKICNMINNKG